MMQVDGNLPAARRAWLMVVLLLLAYVIAVIDRQIMALIVDPVRQDLRIGDAQIGLLQGPAFAVLYCTMGIPLGRMADRTVRKRLVSGGIILWSVATILCGFATTFGQLFACRMAVGVGEAALVPAALSLISDSFPAERQTRATAVFALGGLIGVGMGFLTGGSIMGILAQLTASSGELWGMAPWRLAFIAVGLPGPAIALLLLLLVREPARTRTLASPDHDAAADTLVSGLRLLWRNARVYAPFYVITTCMATIAIPGLTWFPTHLIRTFGFAASTVGVTLGVIYLATAVLGTVIATALLERTARHRSRPHLRVLLLLAVICTPVAITAPLVSDPRLAFTLWFFVQIPLGGYYAIGLNALQATTPASVRALNVAIFMLVVNLIGLAFGAAAVGAISEFVFGDKDAVGQALALIFAIVGPIAAGAALWGLRQREMDAEPNAISAELEGNS